jgi:hypothetical protein
VRPGVQADVEATGKLPERSDALFPADVEKHLQRLAPLGEQGLDALGIKVRASCQAEKFAAEHPDFWIQRHDRLVAINLDNVLHGLTPWLSSHFLMLAIAPLSVSGEG